MTIFAIDPGSVQSGWVLLQGGRVIDSGLSDNNEMLAWIRHGQHAETLAIEMMCARGMPMSNDEMRTLVWIGRFVQCWHEPSEVELIYRQDVKLHVCGNAKARDSNIRQALIDSIGAPGTKKAPGPTYGLKSHAWSALAVAVTARAALKQPETA